MTALAYTPDLSLPALLQASSSAPVRSTGTSC